MKLELVESQHVVRHASNGSFYRVERPERGRVRVWPLELFPTGLLICKSTPTIVDGDLEVVLIGLWSEDMVVDGKPKHTKGWYEKRLAEAEAKLLLQRQEYEELPIDGKGKQSRGSFANIIKSTERTITTIRRGLGFQREQAPTVAAMSMDTNVPAYSKDDLVQLPSGLPALVHSVVGGRVLVRTRYRGQEVRAQLPPEVLLPWRMAQVCTV